MSWSGDERRETMDANDIAETAVRRFFAILGVDVDDPRQVEEFREDLRAMRKLRRAADHGFIAFVGVVFTAVAAAIWAGVESHLRR